MTDLTRRFFLTRSAVLGCSLAASPLLTPVTFAAAPWDTRLVVIILRGAMDGLDAVQPYGDANYAGLRSSLAGGPQNGAMDLERLLGMISESDPAMHAALAEAALLSAADAPAMSGNMARDMQEIRKGGQHLKIAEFAAKRLREDARVASFSLNGWDTHRFQERGLKAALGELSDTLVHLKQELTGPVWNKTAVVAMTEFGRTARENGTGGTDHGTGGLMVMAGGAIKGGKVYGDWPGLRESDLYEGRDLMPTRDVRAHAAWIMQAMTGLDKSVLERVIFPGLDMGSNPGIVL